MTDPYWRTVLTLALAVVLAVATIATYYVIRYPTDRLGPMPIIIDRLTGDIITTAKSIPVH